MAALHTVASRRKKKKRIAILDMGPQAKAAITDQTAPGMGCCPSDPAVLAAAFNRAGYTAVLLDSEQASNPILLTPKNIDLLVLPFGNLFPASAREALLQFLKQGGLFLSTGGYAFDRLVIQSEGKWYDPLSSPIGNAVSVAVLDAGTAGWSMSSSRGEPTPALHAVAGPAGAPAWELHTSNLQAWATGLTPPVAQKLPADWSITRFRAKGDQHTPMLAIEWHETDGSRWKKLVPLTTQWQEYILFASDFAFWKDGSNIRRGGAGDQLQPEQAKRLMFGVSADMAEPNAAHSVWIADIRVQKDAARQMRKTYNLNTRYGLIRDAIHPTPEQIGVFDSSFPLRFVVKTRPTAGQSVITDFTLDGSLAGYSAMGMLGVNGHGFDANRARWQPLLDCVDAFDRPRGHAVQSFITSMALSGVHPGVSSASPTTTCLRKDRRRSIRCCCRSPTNFCDGSTYMKPIPPMPAITPARR